MLCTDLYTPATAYSPYYEAMANKLNQAFPMGDNPHRPFRPAPNQVDLAIHRLPRSYMPHDQEDLLPALSLSISNAVGVTIFAARFLQPDPVKRAEKPTTSVVVAVAPADVPKFGTSISLFSRSRRVEKAHSSSRSSQCRNCNKFGHSAPACKASHPTCPLCANSHSRRAHRCPNPTCPKMGNIKSVPNCCPASPLRCSNCDGLHTAFDRECPSRPVPIADPTSAPPSGDDMDQAEDGAPGPAPPASPAPLGSTSVVTPPRPATAIDETPRGPPPRSLQGPAASQHAPRGLFSPAPFNPVTSAGGLFGAPLPKQPHQRPGWLDGSSPTPNPPDQ